MGEIKRTPLFLWHKTRRANFSVFGGYEMPLWYGSARSEHLSVLLGAGIFDTSHMAGLLLKGKGSRDLLQRCFSRDLDRIGGKIPSPLKKGQLVYGVFLNEDAHVIDDSIVYKVEEDLYFVVVNASMGSVVAEHLRDNLQGLDVDIGDLTDSLGKIDIQGPGAPKIMYQALKEPDVIFESFPYFSFKGFFDSSVSSSLSYVELKNGIKVLLSRSGYTGEIGFEIYVPSSNVVKVWEFLFEVAGKELVPCGLAARDSLRAGACLPLSHQDIGPWPFLNNPWDFCLPWEEYLRSFTKDFIGRSALESLLRSSYSTYTYPFLGFDLRKVNMEDEPEVLDEEGNVLGRVLTCVTDMGISVIDGKVYSINSKDRPENFKPRGVACGFVLVEKKLSEGALLLLRDKRRTLKVKIVSDIRPGRTARMDIKKFL